MSKKEDFNGIFYFENDENTMASDNANQNFEDISSSSVKKEFEDVYSLSDFSGKGRYKKKPHNFWGKIGKWWSERKTWQKSAMITAASFLLIISIALGVLRVVFDYNYNSIDTEDLGVETVVDENIVNVALFGIDTRNTNSFKGNSDSIMILSLNTVTKKVKIISVMRDTLVPITYNGKTMYKKINSAYATGGPELGIKTLNTVFGLDISEYATVNFYGMVDIIDAVGGIDAELTWAEVGSAADYNKINGCIKEICDNMGLNAKEHYISKSGPQHLNGVQAVAYSRIRYVANIWGTNNDYGRTDRQRYVMEQLFNKALKLEKSQYMKLVKSLIPCSETSLSYTEIISLAYSVLLNSPSFEQTRIPQQEFIMPSPSNTGAGSVVYYDLDYAADAIHAFIYDDTPLETYIAENGIEKNDWYAKIKGTYQGSSTGKKPTSQEPTNSNTSSDKPTTSVEPMKPNNSGTSNSSDDEDSQDNNSNEENSENEDTSSNDSNSEGTTTEETDSDDSSQDGTSSDGTSSEEGNSSETGNSSTEDTSSNIPEGDNSQNDASGV